VRADDPQVGVGVCAAVEASPSGDWTAPEFDDSMWPQAIVHAASAVRPKDGFDEISWHTAARIIWSDDLERDNVVLCRAVIE